MSNVLHVAVRSEAGVYTLVTAAEKPVTYRVRTIEDPDHRYVTEIDRFGTPVDETINPAICAATGKSG